MESVKYRERDCIVADVTLPTHRVYKSGGIEGMKVLLLDELQHDEVEILDFWPVECAHDEIEFRVKYRDV